MILSNIFRKKAKNGEVINLAIQIQYVKIPKIKIFEISNKFHSRLVHILHKLYFNKAARKYIIFSLDKEY